MANSRLSQTEQFSTSSGDGTRSPPVDFFPGKHRHTAAIYTQARNRSSLIPAAWLNQPKSVLPAVQANGRPSFGSLSPGACPTSKTLLTTAPPLTTGGYIPGHNRHCRSFLTCRISFLVVSILDGFISTPSTLYFCKPQDDLASGSGAFSSAKISGRYAR